MKILVTHGGYKHTLAVVRALGRLGHDVAVIGHRRLSVAFFSRFCRKKYILPTEKTAYTEGVVQILDQTAYDCLIPIGFPQMAWLAAAQDRLRTKTHLVLADAASIALFEDKKATYAWAQKLGVPVPKTFFSDDPSFSTDLLAHLDYPIVVKTRTESAQKALFFPENPTAAEAAVRTIEGLGQPSLISEKLTGVGLGYFALFDKGRCIQDFMHQRAREYPQSGGSSCCAQSIDNEEIRNYGRRILEAAAWHGLAMVEFKTDGQGAVYLLEVNPKFWGSFDLSVAAGVPFLEKYLNIALNQPYDPTPQPYATGVVFSWPFQGDFSHLIEAGDWAAMRLFWSQWRQKKIETNLVWDDLLASIFMIVQGFPALLKAIWRLVFH